VIEQDGELNLQYSIKKDMGEPVQKHISDKEGLVHFNLEDNDYLLSVKKENFATLQTLITISERPFYLKLKLDSLICRPLDFTFLDSETGKKIEDVQIESDEPLYYSGDEYEEKMPCVMPSTKFEVHFLHPSYKTTPFNIAYESVKKEAIKVYMDPALEMTELLVETGDVFVLKNILYAFDSHVLNKNAKEELDKLVDHLFLHPELSIELSSHTDSRGGEKYNQILSDKRAATAKKYLIDKGIQSSRIAAIGYGESRLLNECGDGVPCTEEKHLINRRIEVKVIERK
jgi:outer membrane protein OmpA-like peptidoglycan-associated protein